MKENTKPIKIILILLLLVISLTLPACNNSFTYDDLDQISYNGILDASDYKYIVICWQADCSNCENLKSTVEEYYNYAKKNKGAIPIYGLNVNLSYNKNIVNIDDDYADMIGTTNYKDITTKTTPTILYIVNGTLVNNISDYSTKKPVTEGKAFLNSLMN